MEALRTAQMSPQAAELVQTRWDDAEETSLFSSFLLDRHHLLAGSLRQSWAPAEGQGRAAPLGQPHTSRGFKLPGGGGASRATSAAHLPSPQPGRREQTEVWSGQLPPTPRPFLPFRRWEVCFVSTAERRNGCASAATPTRGPLMRLIGPRGRSTCPPHRAR